MFRRPSLLGRAAWLLPLPLLLACPSPTPKPQPKPPDPCKSGFVGDPSSAPEIQLVQLDFDTEQLDALVDGGSLSLVRAPQGGEVAYVGVLANNVETCVVSLQAQLRDPASGTLTGFEKRTVDLSVVENGWAHENSSYPAEFANVVPCPDFSGVSIVGHTWLLEVSITDAQNRQASAQIPVVPTCADVTDVYCTQECSAQDVDAGP